MLNPMSSAIHSMRDLFPAPREPFTMIESWGRKAVEVWKNAEFKISESFVYADLENGGGFEPASLNQHL